MAARARSGARALALIVLLGCHGAPALVDVPRTARPAAQAPAPAVDPGTRPATPAELQVVAALMRETEALRGLRFRAPIDVRIASRAGMRSYVLHALDAAQLARARRRYLALGALDPTLDLEALLLSVMEEELIGYYDPHAKRLAVRDDVAQALGRTPKEGLRPEQTVGFRATVVHELVHALQDQHFDLGRIIAEERSTDADNALGALLEGDATLAMIAYGATIGGDSLATLLADPARLAQVLAQPPDQLSGALRRAPAHVREPLLFRYRQGTAFCAAVFRRAGWRGIDAAHHRAPQTTRSIVEPARYFAADHAPPPAVPDDAWLSELGLRAVDEDTLGALEIGVLLGRPTALSHTWLGDRYLVVSHATGDGSLWWITLTSAHAARATAHAFERLGDAQRRIARAGARLLVGYAVPAELFARASAWTDASQRDVAGSTRQKGARGPVDKGVDPLATSAAEH